MSRENLLARLEEEVEQAADDFDTAYADMMSACSRLNAARRRSMRLQARIDRLWARICTAGADIPVHPDEKVRTWRAPSPDGARRSFDEEWHHLAAASRVDDLGGAEYRRVRTAWIADGCPEPLRAYIVSEANRPPIADDGTGYEDNGG
jgi:hypothetical protein